MGIRTSFTKEVNGMKVTLGPRNGSKAPHPLPIQEACKVLGVELPKDAVCKYQPSHYIEKGIFKGNLDTIYERLGDKMPDYDREELEKNYNAFRRKYRSQENIKFNYRNMTVYFTDWLLHCKHRGFTHNCYFDYELYNKEQDIRETFLNEGYRVRVYNACNKPGFRKVFLDKAAFNKTFKNWVRRDWIDTTQCDFEEFKSFVEHHEQFFGKPVRGTGGAGARVIKRESDTLENLFEICKNDNLILEELIKQHKELAEFNASTLNTVRINTLRCADDEVRILLTVARFGRAGNVVDNFHGGGVGAIVDIETGVIITEAINRGHLKDYVHPDSKKAILGFQYPEWEKVKKAVCEAALLTPNVRHVGWDVCVTENGEVEFVEGNSRPNFDVLQSPDQLGRRFRYEPYLPALEELAEKESI